MYLLWCTEPPTPLPATSSPLHLSLASAPQIERKNLAAAIAVSQKPGYFEYYKRNDECVNVEKHDEFKKLTRQIKRLQRDIDQVNHEIGKQAQCKPISLLFISSSFHLHYCLFVVFIYLFVFS